SSSHPFRVLMSSPNASWPSLTVTSPPPVLQPKLISARPSLIVSDASTPCGMEEIASFRSNPSRRQRVPSSSASSSRVRVRESSPLVSVSVAPSRDATGVDCRKPASHSSCSWSAASHPISVLASSSTWSSEPSQLPCPKRVLQPASALTCSPLKVSEICVSGASSYPVTSVPENVSPSTSTPPAFALHPRSTGRSSAGRRRLVPMLPLSLVARDAPVLAHADRDVEGDGQLGRSAHVLPQDGFHLFPLAGRDFHDEFVVDLQQHPRGEAGAREGPGHFDHRHLDDVRRGPLDGGVQRRSLRHFPALAVIGGEVGQVAAPAQEGFGVPGRPGLVDDLLQVVTHPTEAGEVVFHEVAGF